MDRDQPRRTLVVANRTASTALLLEEVRRRAIERPTTFTLLIPNVESKKAADWTLEEALKSLRRAAWGPVDGIVGGTDAFESIHKALTDETYDEVMISTLSQAVEGQRLVEPGGLERLPVPLEDLGLVDRCPVERVAEDEVVVGGMAGGS